MLDPFTAKDAIEFQEVEVLAQGKHPRALYKSLDASIMDLADDIAYGVHDLEDAIALRLISRHEFSNISDVLAGVTRYSEERLFSGRGADRKQVIGAIVHHFIGLTRLEKREVFSDPQLDYRVVLPADAADQLKRLRDFVYHSLVQRPEVQSLEYRGRQVVRHLFNALRSDSEKLIPPSFWEKCSEINDEKDRMRVVCDFIACMTDQYANRYFERLFLPRHGSVFALDDSEPTAPAASGDSTSSEVPHTTRCQQWPAWVRDY